MRYSNLSGNYLYRLSVAITEIACNALAANVGVFGCGYVCRQPALPPSLHWTIHWIIIAIVIVIATTRRRFGLVCTKADVFLCACVWGKG
jgi:hypothetical protein